MKINKLLSILLINLLFLSIVVASVAQFSAESVVITNNSGVIEDTMVPVLDSSDSGLIGSNGTTFPSSVDLSTSNSFPCVRDQGDINSCVGWATTYYQFGFQVADMNGWDAKNDPTKQFSPRWTYNIINYGENNGAMMSTAYDLLKSQGAVRYSEFTPGTVETVSEYRTWYTDIEDIRNALRYRISNCDNLCFSDTVVNTPITSYNDPTLYGMKSKLNDRQVLTFTTDSSVWDLKRLSSEYNTTYANEWVCIRHIDPENWKQGHAMAIVGYDDNIQYDLNNDGTIQNFEKGAFKVVNSGGTSFRNQGFIWVMYDALNRVSNAPNQNDDIRKPIIYDNVYYAITVEEYPLDLIAEVTLTLTQREQTNLKLGVSSLSATVPPDRFNTLFANNGGEYNFTGTGDTVETATFAFDFGSIITHPAVWKKYYIEVSDKVGGNATTIDSINIIDSSGKTVVNDAEEKTVSGTTTYFDYKLGMVGDVDNNASITMNDVALIQRYTAQQSILSNEALKVADVDGDGSVTTIDSTKIQRVIAKIDVGFTNGVYSRLDL